MISEVVVVVVVVGGAGGVEGWRLFSLTERFSSYICPHPDI